MAGYSSPMSATEADAARLRAALECQDLAAYGEILDENVRWGAADETPETCHTRADVVARLTRQRAAGLQTQLLEIVAGEDTLLAGFKVTRPGSVEETVYQVLRVRNGQVVDIRGYPTRAAAAAQAGIATHQVTSY